MNPLDLIDRSSSWGYLTIFLWMVVLAPETLMPFAGFLAHKGALDILWVVAAGTAGGVVGSTALYLLARWVGEARVRRLFRPEGFLLRASDLDRVLAAYRRYGDLIVLFGRAVPTVRSLVSLPAGLLPMPLGRFLLFTALGTAGWNLCLAMAGYLLEAKWRLLASYLGIYGAAIGTLLAVAVLLLLLHRIRERVLSG